MKTGLFSAEIAEPYAQALMSVAQSNNLVDRIAEDVDGLLNLMESSDDLRGFFESPMVDPEKKKSVIRQSLGEQIHPFTLNFLMLLVDKGRIFLLEPICQQFKTLLRQLNQSLLAEVFSAVELTEEQRQAVQQKVMSLSQARHVELETRVDPDLLGGVVIKVGSQVFDASLRGQLRRIGLRLSNAT